MKLSDVVFPGTYEELAAMPSAELRVLVGKLDGGTALHPKIASMGYHMTKAERVNFLGYHHYGIGSSDLAKNALANAEVKYADHQAKKGTKTGTKVTGTGPSTNCTATAAKALSELAEAVPPLTKFAANIDGWAAKLIDPPNPTELKAWAKQLATDTDGGNLGNLDDVLKVDQFLTDWTKAAELANNYGGAPTPKALYEAAVKLKASADDVAGIIPKTVPEAHGLAGSMLSTANTNGGLSIADVFNDLFDAVDGSDPSKLVSGLKKLAEVPDTITPQNAQNAFKVATQAIDSALPKLDNQQLAELEGIVSALSKKMPTSPGFTVATDFTPSASKLVKATKAAVKELEDEAAATAAQAAAAASSEALDATKAIYAAKTKAELKKLGPAVFKANGVDTPSLAHYLTKDELAEAIAKLDNGVPIDDLLDIANAKKASHKGQATATQKAVKEPKAPDAPAYQAAPDTLPTTDLPAPAAQAKATAEKLPETQADVEALANPAAGPPPDSLGQPGAKYAKPAQVEHAYSYKPNQSALGGAHTKAEYLDEDQNVWMWKKAQTKGVAEGEALAHDIGWDLGFDMADIRYAEGWQVPGKGTFPHGTVQKFHQGVKGNMQDVPVGAMTPQQLSELQEHQVFDWLISQHDTHNENILVMADGHLVPIDKGQAFKFFGNDKLEVGYKPAGNFGRPVYYDLWDDYAAGKVDLDLDAIDNVLARIDQLDDDEYLAKMLAYAKQRFKDGGSDQFLPSKLRSPEKLAQAMLERKRGIREDFTAFYQEQAKRRGVSWKPVWETRLEGATPELIEEVGQATVAAGITTPITQAVADDVQKLGYGGRAIHLAGKDVNQSQALVYTEKAANGKTVLRLELRLEPEAERRVTTLLRELKDDAGAGMAVGKASGPTGVADPFWGHVLSYAKTVGAHADDGAYNVETVKKAKFALEKWEALATNKQAKAKDLLAAGDIDGWATAQAEAEQLAHYGKAYDLLADAQAKGIKPPFPIEQYDATKAKQAWLAKAPEAPKTKTVEPAKTVFTKLEVGRDRYARTNATGEFLERQRTGKDTDILVGNHYSYGSGWDKTDPGGRSIGRQWDGSMSVNGSKVTMHYRGYDTTAAVQRKGLMDLELEGWDGSADDIEKLLAAVDRLGVDVRLATAEDEALSYWRQLSGSWKHSVEYENPSAASGPYAKVRKTIDDIEAKVAKAGNLTPHQEAALHREAWAEVFGDDAVARAPERITHRRNIKGEEMGYGHIDRFDLPEDMASLWGKQAGYVHGTNHMTSEQLTNFAGAETTQDLLRVGSIDLAKTTSAADDLYTGGAGGTFASPGWSSWSGGRDIVVGSPAQIDRRVSTYGYTGDRYGALDQRKVGTYLDPTKAGHKSPGGSEYVIRGGVSYGDDMEVMIVRTKSKHAGMLADLRRQGVTEIRGRPIEERILYAQTDSQAQELIRKVTAERPEMFRPYDAPPLTKGAPEPGVPAKKKPTKTPKAKKAPAAPAPETPPYVDPFAAPSPTAAAGQISNAFSDLKYADGLNNPYDADFPQSLPDLYEAMAKQLANDTDLNITKAKSATLKALQSVDLGLGSDMIDHLNQAIDFGSAYHGLAAGMENLDTVAKKIDLLLTTNNKASKQHMAELLGEKDWNTLYAKYDKAADGPDFDLPLPEWLKKQAAPDAGPTPAGALQVDMAEPTGLLHATPGQKVTSYDGDNVYNYAVPGIPGKLQIQFSQVGGYTKAIGKHTDGNWYVIAETDGQVSKGDLVQKLKDMGWPGVKP